jgi:integrase
MTRLAVLADLNTWCGPRHHQRWSPLWRPLEKGLSTTGQRQALVILKSMFDFFVSQNYSMGNPFAAVAKPTTVQRALGSTKTLTFAQWDFLNAQLNGHHESEPARRLRRAMRLLYATGLRLDEITHATTDDLQRITVQTASGSAEGWLLTVVGKGDRLREVPVPETFVEDFEEELRLHGFEGNIKAVSNNQMRLLARFELGAAQPLPWSASGLYKAIVRFAGNASLNVDAPDAPRLRKATTHWLRHTHASHALHGRQGRAPVPIQFVQNNLGHSSVGTTSGYLTTERDARVLAMEGFWGAAS